MTNYELQKKLRRAYSLFLIGNSSLALRARIGRCPRFLSGIPLISAVPRRATAIQLQPAAGFTRNVKHPFSPPHPEMQIQ